MAFIDKIDPVVLNIKLTSKGRELLSTGKLTFKYFAIGDSEIDYGFVNEIKTIDNTYTPSKSSILRPLDNNPSIISFIPRNLSGDPYNAISTLPTAWYPVTNTAESVGFFTSNGSTFIMDSNHVKQPDAMAVMSDYLGASPLKNELKLRKGPQYGRSGEEPAVNDLILVRWTLGISTTTDLIDKNHPSPYLTYKIVSKTGTLAANNLTVVVDRKLPDFTGYPTAGINAGVIVYKSVISFSGDTLFDYAPDYLDESVISFLENNQCPTVIFPFWKMSIVFTEEIAGVQLADRKFSQFDSRTYGGFVSYIQQQAPTKKKLGIIHYTNSSPANVYAEGFYQKTPRLDIPTIMWHKSSGGTLGAKFKAGNSYTLTGLNAHYFDLIDDSGNVVGKIFDELKLFVIEDQELLFAMSYKANRSWTLPNCNVTGGGGCFEEPVPVVLSVTTIPHPPVTVGVGYIGAAGGRNISGLTNITRYGVRYKLYGTPTWNTSLVIDGTLAIPSFTLNIMGLSPNTTYEYEAVISNGINEYYGGSVVVTTLPTPTTQPPTTAAPTTAAPTTAAPTTAAPTTQPPTTQPPTTAAPTTQPPTTAAPTTTQPPKDINLNTWASVGTGGGAYVQSCSCIYSTPAMVAGESYSLRLDGGICMGPSNWNNYGSYGCIRIDCNFTPVTNAYNCSGMCVPLPNTVFPVYQGDVVNVYLETSIDNPYCLDSNCAYVYVNYVYSMSGSFQEGTLCSSVNAIAGTGN